MGAIDLGTKGILPQTVSMGQVAWGSVTGQEGHLIRNLMFVMELKFRL